MGKHRIDDRHSDEREVSAEELVGGTVTETPEVDDPFAEGEPLIGDFAVNASDGVVISASSDVNLAWKLAEYQVDLDPEADWSAMSPRQRRDYAGKVLTAIRPGIAQAVEAAAEAAQAVTADAGHEQAPTS